MKIILKELREIYINLKIIHRCGLHKDKNIIMKAKAENNELIAIFVKSISTAQTNSHS